MSGLQRYVETERRALSGTSSLQQDVGTKRRALSRTSGLQQDVGIERRTLRQWCNETPARLRWWSGEVPAVVRRGSCGCPAVVRRDFCGGSAVVRRPSRRSFLLLFLLLLLGSPLMRNEGSIYRFSGVAWSVNRCEIRGE
ncbi:hypothetical protein KFK09_006192 [Dendrobium nobile]|uniref:Uncharacterized protein n=1 Tax=Dendrobium nobile TaxID=94219 RepID=A0A8T3BRB8_DENNO|nr:hypothetical protein KFK09_006192 [Dendrobium nobile]